MDPSFLPTETATPCPSAVRFPRGCDDIARAQVAGDLSGAAVRPTLVHVVLLCLLTLLMALPVSALALPSESRRTPGARPGDPSVFAYRCDGKDLLVTLHGSAVDAPTIPNSSGGTLPGAFVVLRWHDDAGAITLQLPRTNNAGPPSFTDGKWWWSLEDPENPRFRLRRGRGDVQELACEPAGVGPIS